MDVINYKLIVCIMYACMYIVCNVCMYVGSMYVDCRHGGIWRVIQVIY